MMIEPSERNPSVRRVATAIAAAILLAALLLGVPWLLLCWGRPANLAAVDWGRVFLRPDDGRVTLGVLSLAGWLAWAVLALTTAGELLHTISRGRITFRIPGTGWLRPVVALLVAAALSPLLSANAAPSLADVPAAVTAPAEVRHDDPAEPAPQTAQQDPGRWREYEVQPGDELWDIAARELGAGQRWRQLVAANPGIDIDHPPPPGTVLRLPLTVTVEQGDSLWHLAQQHLGDPERWPEIHEANRDQISDPDEIDAGWVLTLPGADVADSSPYPVPPPVAEQPSATEQATPPPSTVPTGTPEPVAPSPGAATTPPPEVGAPVVESTPAAEDHVEEEHIDLSRYLGPLGGLLAAGVITSLSLRRRNALHERPLGQRSFPVPAPLERFWTALGRRGAEPQADAPTADLSPTAVLLGWRDKEEVWVTLEESRCLWVRGTQPDILGMTASTWTSLLCAEWSAEVNVVAAHPREAWAETVDDPRLVALTSCDEALTHLERLCASRRVALGPDSLTAVRSDPDRAAEFTPTVFIFCDYLTTQQTTSVARALELGQVGVSVVAPVQGRPPGLGSHLDLQDTQVASLDSGTDFEPQLIPGPARHALVGLFASSITPEAEPAPWWRDDPPGPDDNPLPGNSSIKDPPMAAEPHSPTLLLLGEVDLVACDGPRPTRAAGRCLECCAWLLSNPGATPTQMRESLMVAESTRRSNMSRLRGWLGRGPDGAHLPDAYSGHIQLSTTVSSDWERFQSLLAGGVNMASESLLAEALALVRGAPLGSFEFQWSWAEQLRSDMVSMIVDAAAVLADRCMARREHRLASWAISQGVRAAGEVEPLVARRILLLSRRGDRAAVDREVLQLTRSARASGRDLGPDSVRMIQEALQACREGPRPERSAVR